MWPGIRRIDSVSAEAEEFKQGQGVIIYAKNQKMVINNDQAANEENDDDSGEQQQP